MEIHPCVPRDIGPLGPLPCSHLTSSAITSSRASGTADHVRSLDDLFLIFYSLFPPSLCQVLPTNSFTFQEAALPASSKYEGLVVGIIRHCVDDQCNTLVFDDFYYISDREKNNNFRPLVLVGWSLHQCLNC